jgi:hypothetical protein
MAQIGMILLGILLIFMALVWFGVNLIPPVVLGILAVIAAIFILIEPVMAVRNRNGAVVSIGTVLLAILLFAMALLWFSVPIPLIVMGVLAVITAIFILIGR